MPDALSFAQILMQRAAGARVFDAASGGREPVARAADVAGGFLAAGLVPGDVLILLADLSVEAVIAYLAALHLGLVPLPIHPSDIDRFLPGALGQVKVAGCWAREAAAFAGLPDGPKRLHGLPGGAAGAVAPRRGGETAVLMMTSGSTGTPDLIAVSSDNLLANTRAIVASQRLGAAERAMLILPLGYCFGASVAHSHLWAGGDLVVDRRFMFPEKVIAAMAAYGCTSFAGVPTAYRTLAQRSRLGESPLPALRRFLQAGGALDQATIAAIRSRVPHAAFFVMYGQTEATSRIATLPPEDLDRKPGSVGLPIDGVAVTIVDENGAPLPSGRTGEIVVRGASVARPLRPNAKLRGDALYTGDLGHFDAEGYLYVDGRKSEFLKCRGVRIGLAEIEHAVLRLPDVAAAMAFPVADPDCGEAIGLAVVPRAPEASAEAVRAAIVRALPRPWAVAALELVPHLPTTSVGKPDRARFRPAPPPAP